MSETFAPRLSIAPDAQRFYVRLLIATHLLAAFACLIASLPWLARLILLLSILVSAVYQWRHWVRDRRESPTRLSFSEQEGWSIQEGSSEPLGVDLRASSVATRWITILHFTKDAKLVQSLLIPRDSVSCADYRTLQTILKMAEKKV